MKYINTCLIVILVLFTLNKYTYYDNLLYYLEIESSKKEDYFIDELESKLNFDIQDGNLLGEFEATAYSDNIESQGKWLGQTATGRKPQVGVIAVDPTIIPLETSLFVEGYGYCVAGDVGGAIKGDRLDLYMDTKGECTKWGRRGVRVWRVD